MAATRTVAVLVGSLRKASYSRKAARALIELAPENLLLEIVEIGDLPLYNQDLDDGNDVPPAWARFREELRTVHAVLFVTPEYNRSVPGVLKNAIDVGSRPRQSNAFAGKPGAVVSISPGAIGGFGANHALRQSLVFLNVHAMGQPEAYVGQAASLFNAEGKLIMEETREFFRGFMSAFAAWIDRLT
jgi:chromate reductase